MASKIPAFTEEEMSIDPSLGYPKAYSKLCNRNTRSYTNPYTHGPPLSFLPYTLQPQEALRAKDLNQLFPVIDPEAKPMANSRGYVNLLWKQLDHLGNAGFDPALFRVDPFGNVLYLHADLASPLAWDIDHWFPCSRGGRTLPSNLRLLQWQVCKKKKNKLEFLVPWWDLQLGISVNQFLSIFASKNSDFRNRAFSFLFSDGGSEELNAVQTVDSHSFPQHFIEMKQQVGLAPAAIVSTHRNSDASVLKPLDINKSLKHNSPFPGIKKFSSTEDESLDMAIQKFRPNTSKENEQPESDDFTTNPYLSIARARDSLRQKEEWKKKDSEVSLLEGELNELTQKNEADRIALQDLEALLITRRRRVEKCRRLAEAQSSYRSMLEKMIRDAMHQSVVYKEQLRLNQAATSALMARLEAQRAICDTSENELRRKFKQRDEIEKQIRPCWEEQARKRSRMDYTLFEERHEDCIKGWTPLKKELRVLLEEEQKASEAGLSVGEEEEDETEKDKKCRALTLANSKITDDSELKDLTFREGICRKTTKPKKKYEAHENMIAANDEKLLNHKLRQLAIRDGSWSKTNENRKEGNESKKKPSNPQGHPNEEEDEEHMNQIGKGNVERWLQMMLGNAEEGASPEKDLDRGETTSTAETDHRIDQLNPEKEIECLKLKPLEERRRSSVGCRSVGSRKSFEVKEREGNRGGFDSCESSRGFRSVPSSPSSVTLRMRSVDGKKPKVVMGDGEKEANLDSVASRNSSKFIKTCARTIKRAVNK